MQNPLRSIADWVNRVGGQAREPTALRRGLLAIVLGTAVILRVGWHTPLVDPGTLHLATAIIMALYAGLLVYAALVRRKSASARRAFVSSTRFEIAITAAGVALIWWWPGLATCAVALVLLHLTRGYLSLVQRTLPPGLVFIGSFALLVVVGTALLMLPAATPTDRPIGLIDAGFTITSAVSQTGLVIRETGDGFTRFGQTIILIWIQVGALGVIVFGALLATVMGRSFGLKATQTLGEPTEQGWAGQFSLAKLVTFIIIATHGIEAIGAALFYFGWPETWAGMPADMDPATGGDWADRLYHAVFFSVSSFCNAGFVTTGDSMASLRAHWTPHAVIAPMIILGSIGFPVLDNLARVAIARLRGRRLDPERRLVRLSLNSKLILSTAAALYVAGFVVIFLGEVTQAGVPIGTAALDAHFMNINRTAGFNTISPDEMGLLSQLFLIFLMFVGGAPASVAGGIKLIALAVMLLTIWTTVLGRPQTIAFGRTIPDALVRKSATIVVLCLIACLTTTGVLSVTELSGQADDPTLKELLFESVSAFGTTGLSLGITQELSDVGKVTLSVAMFTGRVGVLAVVATLITIARRHRPRVEYPTEELVVY